MVREEVSLFAIATKPDLDVPSFVAKQYAEQLEATAVLYGDEYTPEAFAEAVRRLDPAFVFVESHGFPCSVTAQGVRPAISTEPLESEPAQFCPGDANLDLLEGRIVHFNACWTGLRLGKLLVENHGVRAFFGTKEPFYFLIPVRGGVDKMAVAPFLAEYTVEVALFSGLTAGEAHRRRIKAFDTLYQYYTTGEGRNLPGAELLARFLLADRNAAVFYGDGEVRFTDRVEEKRVVVKLGTPPAPRGEVALLILALPFVLGGRG
jgi:hypothetical protein